MSPSPEPHDRAIDWLRLTLVPGVSMAAHRQLLQSFGSPRAVLAAPQDEVAAATTPRIAAALRQGARPEQLEHALSWLSQPGHHLLALDDERYPPALLHTADPPTVLYAAGDPAWLRHDAIAIVGSRNASYQGRRDAEEFARAFSESGLCVVSGLAIGIDAAAHAGGLRGPSSSVAVVGTGADIVYPRENAALAARLCEEGCIVSEFALGTPASRHNFPRRNRLISGLAKGVLVVEAAVRSGSLITAREALDQGRDVFAVPGSIHSAHSKGCHRLIRQGAKLVERVDDVLEEIGWPTTGTDDEAGGICRRTRDPVLDAVGFTPTSMDEVAVETGLPIPAVAARLSRLELDGRILSLPGGWFQRPAKGRGTRVIE